MNQIALPSVSGSHPICLKPEQNKRRNKKEFVLFFSWDIGLLHLEWNLHYEPLLSLQKADYGTSQPPSSYDPISKVNHIHTHMCVCMCICIYVWCIYIYLYRLFHPKAEYTFFSSAQGTVSRIDHMLSLKTSLGKFMKIEIILSIVSNSNALKLESNYNL